MTAQRKANYISTRNVTIFAIVALSSGWIGHAVDLAVQTPKYQNGLGILIWILLPTVTGLLLRALGGDGWAGAGFGFKFRPSGFWYSFAMVLFPIVSLLTIAIAAMWSLAFGFEPLQISAAKAGFAEFAQLVFLGIPSLLIKNVLEEFAWRGYLTQRLSTFNIHPISNHVLTGIIWALWHLPFWLYFVDISTFSQLELPKFIALGLLIIVITSITYGELRLISQSVWPCVILHTVANAVTAALVFGTPFSEAIYAGALLSAGNDGLVHSLLFAGAGWVLYRYRSKKKLRSS
jgi:membrane protease YdiL (CAAX protease family)